jgi:hypothetical protein
MGVPASACLEVYELNSIVLIKPGKPPGFGSLSALTRSKDSPREKPECIDAYLSFIAINREMPKNTAWLGACPVR